MIKIKLGTVVLHKINEFTFQEADMGDSNITLTLKLPVEVDPNFSKDMYVEYLGEKFYLTNTKPQGVKDISSLMYSYSLVFESRTYELKYRMVRDLVDQSEELYVSRGLVFSSNLTIFQFFDLIQMNLTSCFGDGAWNVDINPTLVQPNSVRIDVSNAYIWDLLLKTDEYYGVRWNIVSVASVMVIKVGYPTIEIDHVFKYGSSDGLTKITREADTNKIVNRLRGVGGSRNVPVNYFSNRYSGFEFDDVVVGDFFSAKNILPFCFRQSVVDQSFIDYVQDDILVAEYGVIEDGLEPNEDIYPSIEGVIVENLGRIDEIVCSEFIETDQTENVDMFSVPSIVERVSLPILKYPVVEGYEKYENAYSNISETITFPVNSKKITAMLSVNYIDQFLNTTIPTGDIAGLTVRAGDGKDVVIFGSVNAMSVTWQLILTSTNTVISSGVVNTASQEKTVLISCDDLIAGNYKFKLTTYVDGALGVNGKPIKWFVDISLQDITNSNGSFKPSYNIWVKDIGFNLAELKPDGTSKYAGLENAVIAFKSGDLAGYEFEIHSIGKRFVVEEDTTKSLNGVPSKYRISLIKSNEESKTGGFLLPSTSVHAHPTTEDMRVRPGHTIPTTGDKFVILNIEMPSIYVMYAEQRQEQFLRDQLNKMKVHEPVYTIEFLDGFIEKYKDTIKQKLRRGNVITIQDTLLTTTDVSLFINNVTIKHGGLLPKYTCTVTNKRTVNGSTVQRLQAQIDALYTGQYSIGQSSESSILALKNRFLQKTIADTAYEKITFKKGLVASDIKTDNFTQGQFAGSGGAIYRDIDGSTTMEIDKIRVRKEAIFNEIVINQIKFQGGIVVYSAANMEVSSVQAIGGDYRLFFDTKGGTVKNLFEKYDIIRCNRFSTSDGTTKYYSTVVIEVGVDCIDISGDEEIMDMSSGLNPEVGDIVVQFGNADTSHPNRKSVIEMNVLQGGKQTFYQNVINYNLDYNNAIEIGNIYDDTELLEIDKWKTMLRVYGDAYIGTRGGGNYIKLNNKKNEIELKGNVIFKSPTADGFEYVTIPIALDKLQMAGRNLIIRNQIEAVYSTDVVFVDDKLSTVVNDTTEHLVLSANDSIIKAGIYTCSGYIYINGAPIASSIFIDSVSNTYNNPKTNDFKFSYNELTGRFEVTEYHRGTKKWCIHRHIAGLTIGDVVSIDKLMFEKGNRANDWVLSPEDVQANISKVKQDAFDEINHYVGIMGSDIADLQSQIDGVVVSWFYQYSPTELNEPWLSWVDPILFPTENERIAEQNNHIGDTFTNTTVFVEEDPSTHDSGVSWRFIPTETGFTWLQIRDSKSLEALQAAIDAQDTADSKRQVFVAQPTILQAYNIGDIWLNATISSVSPPVSYSNEMLRCAVKKNKGDEFSLTHWVKATKYTDDSLALTAANDANTAIINAAEANTKLTSWSSDNVLSPIEKQATIKEWSEIVNEKSKVEAQASLYGLSSSVYNAKYNVLDAYLNYAVSPSIAILANLSESSAIVGTDFRYVFSSYYIARQTLLNAIAAAAKNFVGSSINDIQIGGRNLILKSDFSKSLDGIIAYIGSTKTLDSFYRCNISNTDGGDSRAHFEGLTLKANVQYIFQIERWWDDIEQVAWRGSAVEYLMFTEIKRENVGFENGVRVFYKITLTQDDTGFIQLSNTTVTGEMRLRYPKLEIGTLATGWSAAPEDIQSQIDDNYQAIEDMSNDNLLQVSEKLDLQKEWALIQEEYTNVIARADQVGVDSGYDERSEYSDAYSHVTNGLTAYIITLNLYASTDTVIDRVVFRAKFFTYYEKRNILINVINYNVNYLAKASYDETVDMASNSVFDKAEKLRKREEWNVILGERSILELQATNLSVSSVAYEAAFQALAKYLNNNVTWSSGYPSWLASYTTNTYGIVAATFIANYKGYYDARTTLINAISNAPTGGENLLRETSFNLNAGTDNNFFKLIFGSFTDIPSKFLRNGATYVLSAGTIVNNAGSASRVQVLLYDAINVDSSTTWFFDVSSERQMFTFKVPATGKWSIIIYAGEYKNTYGNSINCSRFMLQLGNKPTEFQESNRYLREAMVDGNARFEGGLALANIMMLGSPDGDVKTGLSGMEDNIGFWTGGTYQDATDDKNSSFKSAKKTGGLDRKDGAGHRAKGNLAWNELGQIFIGNEKDKKEVSISPDTLKPLADYINKASTEIIITTGSPITVQRTYPDPIYYTAQVIIGSGNNSIPFTLTDNAILRLNVSSSHYTQGLTSTKYYSSYVRIKKLAVLYGEVDTIVVNNESSTSGGSRLLGYYLLPKGTYIIEAMAYTAVNTGTSNPSGSFFLASIAWSDLKYSYIPMNTTIAPNGIACVKDDENYFYMTQEFAAPYFLEGRGKFRWLSPNGLNGIEITDSGIKKIVGGTPMDL